VKLRKSEPIDHPQPSYFDVDSSFIKLPVVTLSKKFYPYCLVLVGSRNRFERNFTIKLKQIEGLMEDWLKMSNRPTCWISSKPMVQEPDNSTKKIWA